MKKQIFKYKLVYYLTLMTSFILFIISAFGIFTIFENFNVISFIFIIGSIVINSFAFINLIEKYDKAVLFLNLGLFLYLTYTGNYLLPIFLIKGFDAVEYSHFRIFTLLLLILIIVNVFKIKNGKVTEEIEEIGKHND